MVENNFRKKIIKSLKGHPEGLTILNIAENTGISRLTVSKYVFGLVSEGLISQRIIGTAKLCHLRFKK